MNCNDARPLLDLLSDEMLDKKDSALVLDHIKECDSCQSSWHDLEQVRARIKTAREQTQASPELFEKISAALGQEDRLKRQNHATYTTAPFKLASAAIVLLIGLFCLSQQPQFKSQRLSTATQSTARDLIALYTREPNAVDYVSDRTALKEKLGYDPKYVHLPSWKMDKASVLRSRNQIARFDFIRNANATVPEHLSCYQAPQGTITAVGQTKSLGDKQVIFGNQANYQFALWSQNGRDYLFVTTLPTPRLKKSYEAPEAATLVR